MLSQFPPKEARRARFAYGAAWGTLALSGVAAATFQSNPQVVQAMGYVLTFLSGAVLAGGAGASSYGWFTNQYRIIWVSSYIAAAGLVPYILGVWANVFAGDLYRLTGALMLTGLAVLFVAQALYCSAHAAKLRADHEAAKREVDDAGSAGDGNPDGPRISGQ